MSSQIYFSAPAKINLHLHITGRMANGYHTLDSLTVFTDLCDDISIVPSEKFQLTIYDEHHNAHSLDCDEQNNLVSRACHLLVTRLNIPPNVHIKLIKRIPVAAGLGGGSADAAATLLALQKLWSDKINFSDIENIAAELGSDIVACLHQKPVIMRHTGNDILPAPRLPKLYGVLINPLVPCPTPQVYKAYADSHTTFSNDIIFPDKFSTANDLCRFLNDKTSNDLTSPAIKTAPVIQSVLDQLIENPSCLLARLSGSGATCFGIFENEITAIEHAESIRKTHHKWWVRQVTINGN